MSDTQAQGGGFFANLKAKLGQKSGELKGSKMNQFAFSLQIIFGKIIVDFCTRLTFHKGLAMAAYAAYAIFDSVKSTGDPAYIYTVERPDALPVPSVIISPVEVREFFLHLHLEFIVDLKASNPETPASVASVTCGQNVGVLGSSNETKNCAVNTTVIKALGEESYGCWNISLKEIAPLKSKTNVVSVVIQLERSVDFAYIGFFNETDPKIPANPIVTPLSGNTLATFCYH